MKSLRGRILLTMAVAAIASILVVLATVRAVVLVSSQPGWSVSPARTAACTADPTHWHETLADLGQSWAYGPDGRSANPAAPALDPALTAQLQTADRALLDDGHTRIEAQRVAAEGPCAIVTVAFVPPADLPVRIAIGIVAGGALAVLAVTALAVFFILQPLLLRIERIRRAADAVGASGFIPAADPLGDALGDISRTLDTSHARITTNEAELRARQRALERHLAEIAHDLRTPLASLLLAVQEVAPTVPEEERAAVRRALDDAEYVNALIDNLHQGARLREGVEGGAGELDLGDVVERLAVRFGALGALRGIEVVAAIPDAEVRVVAAPAMVERAVANLVHNAVRHGREHGHVAIVLEATPGQFELTVSDDGPGLRPDDLADLRSATFLLEEARRRSGGLGVAITNEVCRRAGWTITYEAPPEGGLHVRIAGSCAPTPAARPGTSPGSPR